MLQVPSSLAGLLSLLAPCFTQPTYRTFCMLMVGFVGRIRDCTVTGMLQAAGLAGEWHHSRAHDFFAYRRWEPDELGLRLLDFLMSVFVAPDAPIRLAVDDTLFGRSGRRVWGAHYLHDGAQPEGAGASKAWRGLPERVSVTTRMRSNAAVHELAATERRPGQMGRTPLKGKKLSSLAEIAKSAIFMTVTVAGPDGRTRTAYVHEFVCLWYTPFYTRQVKVILIRNAGSRKDFDVELASTDADVPAPELIARYDSRWTIETAHQEAKAHGVGEARNRVQKAVERTVPFGFLAQTITITWYALHGNPDADLHAHRRTAPWYRQKTTVSYADMLAALRRELIRHEYWAP